MCEFVNCLRKHNFNSIHPTDTLIILHDTIEEVLCMDDSVRSYKIRFDDDTSESNVLGEYIQFISRPDENDRINDQ